MQGKICSDPEIKDVGGKTVIRFRLSSAAKFKKDAEGKKYYSFFSIDYWPVDKVAGNVQKEVAKLHKGSYVIFDAEPIQERWEKDGNKHDAVKFVVEGWVNLIATDPPAQQASEDDSPFN